VKVGITFFSPGVDYRISSTLHRDTLFRPMIGENGMMKGALD
jgi:hypothetical protein